MTKLKNKAQLALELEQAQQRVADLEKVLQKLSFKGGTAEVNAKPGHQDWEADEAQYHDFIEQSQDGIVILDEHGNVTTWNNAQETLVGISKEEAAGKKFWDIQHQLLKPESRVNLSLKRLQKTLQNFLSVNKTTRLNSPTEAEIQLADGTIKFIQITPMSIKTKNGYRIGAISRDITEQKYAMNILRENEERFSLIFNASPAQMAITDSVTGKYIDVNELFLTTLGFTREEVIGKTAIELNLFFDPAQRYSLLNKMRQQGYLQDEDVLIRTKTGDLRYGVFAAQYIQVRDHQYLLTVMNDITERKKTGQALQDSQEQLRMALIAARMGTWRWDVQTNKVNWSPEASQLLGVDNLNLDIETALEFFHPEDKLDALASLQKTIEKGAFATKEYRILHPKGREVWVTNFGHLKHDANGNLLEISGVIQDITERKQAEGERSERDDRYRLLFETMVQGVVFQDRDGHIIHANPSAEKILGLTLDQMQGRESIDPRWKTIHEDGSAFPGELHPAMITLRSGLPVHNVVMGVYNHTLDTYRWLNVNAFPRFNNGESKPYQVYATFEDITERKQAENALLASEKKLQSLIDSQTHFVIRTDLEGHFTFWNRKFESEFAWVHNPGGLKNANAIETISAYHHERLLAVVRNCLQQPERAFSVELDKPAQDGGVRTILWEFVCITDERNQPIEIQCMGVEITDRNKAENALRESEAKYRLLAENITDVIWVLDLEESRYHYISPSVMQLRGYSQEEALTQSMNDSITEASGQFLSQVMPERFKEFLQGIEKTYTDEIEQPCKDGSTVWTETTTRFLANPENGHLEVYGVSRNITERKKAETIIRQIEKRNTALIEHAPDGIALVDVDGVFMFASPSAYRMFGYNMDDIIGRQSREKVHPDDLYLLADLRHKLYSDPAAPQTLEYRFRGKDGSYHWLESTYTNMFGEPSIEGIVINFRDISERKRAEEMTRQQSEQLRLLYEASQQLNRTFKLTEIYQTICDFMSIIAPSDTLFISSFDHETQMISCDAYWIQNKWLDVTEFPAIPLEEEGKGTQSMVIHSGQAMLLNDYQKFLKTATNVYYVNDETNEIETEDPVEEEITRSALIVPLKSGGVVQGIIQASSYQLNAYTESQLQVLEALALHITSAEQNALLYNQLVTELEERRQAEEALRRSEGLLSEAQRIGRIGHMEWNGREHALICSDEVYDILGIPRGITITQNTIGEMMTKEERDALQRKDMEFIQRRMDMNYEYRISLSDGRKRWLHQQGKVTYSEDGTPIRMMAIIQDITERKQAEETLRAEQLRFAKVSDTIPGAICTFQLRPEGTLCIPYASKAFEGIFGFPVSEAAESLTPLISKVMPKQTKKLVESVQESAKTMQPWHHEYEYNHPTRGRIWIEGFSMPVKEADGTILWHGFSTDITERKQAEENLRETQSRIELALKGANAAMWDWKVQSGEAIFNERWAEIVGYTLQELAPVSIKTWMDLCHPDDIKKSNDLLQKHFTGELEYYECEARMKHKNGSWVWVLDRGKVMEWDADKKPVRMFGTHLDISERKHEERYTQARLKLSNAAHEEVNMETLMKIMLDEAEALTDSSIGFFHFVDEDQNTISLQAWSSNTLEKMCTAEGHGSHYPVAEAGIWADCIRKGEACIYNNYESVPNNHNMPEGHAPVTRLISLPIIRNNIVVAALGIGNKPSDYASNDLDMLKRLAEEAFDIILRKRAEQYLRASEEKYRVLIKSLDNVIASVDPEGRFLYMNDMAIEQLGISTENLTGKTMYDLFPESVASKQMMYIQQVLNEDKGNVYEDLTFARGKPRWHRTSIQPIHNEDGIASQVLVNSTDIHDLKTAQQELQELNRTLEERVKERTAEVQDLYDNAPAGYHSLDADGNITLINQTQLTWMGFTREEMTGRPLSTFLTPASASDFDKNFQLFKERGVLKDMELEFVCKDGTVLPALVNATAVYDKQGTYATSRSTVLDNTGQKAVAEAMHNANLEMARAMRMKDEFLASMSHELRTPLNGILGLSEALQLDVYGPLNDKQKSTLGHVEDSGRHLLELINDILDVSKIEAGKFELEMLPCSLGDICQSSIHLTKGMAGKKRQNVNFTMNPASININADARRLKQILVNLLSNAVKFTPENGSLGLEVTKNEEEKIVYISVWDKGIGISPEDLKKLFQPFVQLDSSLSRQQTGTGLGLTLVQRLVEMHGGSIEIHSALGEGSRFTVALPCLSADLTVESIETRLKPKFNFALIIEDETADSSHLSRYCKALGITPTVVSNGRTALERAISVRPNIIFLDIHLPDISGWDVLEQLKANPETQHIPVVITSVDDEKQKAAQLHADGYLVKFYSMNDLRNILVGLQKTPSSDTLPPTPTNAPRLTVMIVDDNEINIETVVDYLSAKNFHVISATSGVDFLTRVPQLQPDIVLMDIQMPEIDGLETTRRLRSMPDQKLASVPVIALTALAMPGDRERCIEAGADEYITKPFRLKELHELILMMIEDKKRMF